MTGSPIVDVHERLSLDIGWEAVGVPPGAAGQRLAGLDDSMVPATAPGTAASALLAAGHPIAGRDFDAEDWWFRCRFEAPPADPSTETVLCVDGLATLADVWLNGEHVLSSTNMFEQHEIRVDSLLRTTNELVLGFRALAPELAVKRPRPRWRTRLVAHQSLRFVRTTLLGRVAAFAPEPAPVGPWQAISLERRRQIAVDDASLRARLDGDDGVLTVRLRLRPFGGLIPERGSILLDGPTGAHQSDLQLAEEDGAVVVTGELRVPSVARWWPHTHGDPTLHAVRIELVSSGGTVDLDWGRVGFRSLEATTEPGLALSINGVPIFCRGGALMPDLVTLDLSSERLRSVIALARDAGMNMIRLSGVTTYASDDLLALCDELGMLLWQDFPFANMDYPVEDETFHASVESEATAYLARAGRRACLAVLCGNSEVEQQVGMLGLDTSLGHGELFGELLPRLVAESQVDAIYVSSSPTGGELPFRPNAGVAHYFGVGAYRRPLEDARRAEVRFAAECLAFANVPDDALIEAITPRELASLPFHHPAWKRGVPRDSGAGWDFDDVRDHYLRELFRVDPAELRSSHPDRYLALSRVVTGEVMSEVLGEWRRARSTCRGALLWWLNDIQLGAGWGILDANGRPKPAYWYVRRALQPMAVWMTDEGTNGLAVHIANDRPEPLEATLGVELYRDGEVLVDHAETTVALEARTAAEQSVEGILGRFVDAGYAYRFGSPSHDTVIVTVRNEKGLRSQAHRFPLGLPADAEPISRFGFTGRLEETDTGPVLRLRAERLAYGVSISGHGILPTDDWFLLPPKNAVELPIAVSVPRDELTTVEIGAVNAIGRVRISVAVSTAGT